MEEQIDGVDITNNEEITPESEPEVGLPADPIEVEPKDENEADVEALKQRNQELYEQLKKAKGLIRDPKTGKWVKKEVLKVIPKAEEPMDDLTRKEQYSLFKANVPEEDMEECFIYARSHGMNITEALKTPEMKALLKVRNEYRKTAEAANITNSRYGGRKVSDEEVLAKAAEGELADPATMATLRQKQKLERLTNRIR